MFNSFNGVHLAVIIVAVLVLFAWLKQDWWKEPFDVDVDGQETKEGATPMVLFDEEKEVSDKSEEEPQLYLYQPKGQK